MTKTSVKMFTNANKIPAGNIASSRSPGHKKQENVFVNSIIGTSTSAVSYVRSSTRNTNDVQGALITTGVASDVAIEGAGMMLVSDGVGGTVSLTRRGDNRMDANGYLVNGAGQVSLGWELDEQGNLPANFAITSSLKAINLSNTKGKPKATTIFTPSLNLNAQQNALLGAGVTAKMNPNGLNANTGLQNANDIILPDYIPSGGISIGDEFTFTSSSSQQPKKLIYGGIAIANAPSNLNPILGATTVNAPFAFGAGANQIPVGAVLQLNLGGTTYNFAATQGAASIQNKTFNTITNLAAAINSVTGLSATIDTNGRLYIAPTDSTQSLSFVDLNGGEFKAKLGLVDIPLATNNVTLGNNTYRFNSLASLNKAINDQNTVYSLKATIDKGSIDIRSLLATDNFTITGKSLGLNSFNSMTVGTTDQVKGRATVTIPAPGHSLQTGDLVRISDTGYSAHMPAGIYAVGATDSNSFQVYLVTNAAANVGTGGALNQGLPLTLAPVTVNTNATWQKVPGQRFASHELAPASLSAVGVANITIAVNDPQIAVNDVVYISGIGFGQIPGGNDISVPDGYYIVKAVTPGASFDITPATNAAPGLAPLLANNFSYQKVGITGAGAFGAVAGAGTFNSNVMVTPDGINSSTVRLYTTSNNYNTDDWITLTGLTGAGPNGAVTVDGIVVNNNTPYFVKNRTADYIDFTVPAGAATTGDGATGMATYATLGVGDVQIDNISRTMNYLGINQIGSEIVGGNPQSINSVYNKKYDPTNANTSLSSATAFPTSSKFQTPIKLYDSLGGEFNIILNFAKLDDDRWAVEATAQPGSDGVTYDILGARAGDGFLGAGEVTFDTSGKISGSTLASLSISRNNGSAPITIAIDWNNLLSPITSGSVTQYSAPNDIQRIQQDGQSSGTMISYSIGEDGKVTAVFNNGETATLWQIPMAMVANPNGLQAGTNGTFNVTDKSGELLLKAAGVGGAGKFVSQAVEDSNTDVTEELLETNEISNSIRANARVAGTNHKNFATILQELA